MLVHLLDLLAVLKVVVMVRFSGGSVESAALARFEVKQSKCLGKGAGVGADGGHDTGPCGGSGGRVCAALQLADDGLGEC